MASTRPDMKAATVSSVLVKRSILALGRRTVRSRSVAVPSATPMRTSGLSRSAQFLAARPSFVSTPCAYQSSGLAGKSSAFLRSSVASSTNIASIWPDCSAATLLPQVVSTGVIFTPISLATCSPSSTPRPVHLSAAGSRKYHGSPGATPMRSSPADLTFCRVCADAARLPSDRAVASVTVRARRRNEVLAFMVFPVAG